uniref:helix-turn-helix transcriptional regulator n=1 Tax=Saccharomonospora saliphila TaxID=369829 RepID=UPI0003821EB9
FVVARLDGGDSVADLARTVGLSARHLHRRCLRAFGYGPKTLARVLRMRRALEAARKGTPLATVAAEAGYADQAHFSREVRALAGVPVSALLPAPGV